LSNVNNMVETLSGGVVSVTGTVHNSGILFASASNSVVLITSGAVVTGGVALIGDGIVDIAGSSGESVNFLSNGSGGLKIADTQSHTSAFSGSVSGFGGSGHSNKAQFIDLVSVTSAANTISLSYVSAASHTSGTLFVSSGGTMVAAIKMVGSYSVGNFHITSGAGGTVAITGPTVPNGGSVEPGAANVTFGAQTTLAYSEKSNALGLWATEGRYAAALALLGNYMAASFATAAGGHGGAVVTQVAETASTPLLAHPHMR
jgi:hypothetical protein